MSEKKQQYIWHRVFEAGDLGVDFVMDGKMRVIHVEGERLIVNRRGDELFCMRNRCPHSGAPLEKGFFDEKGDLVCPWHRFRFCVKTGKNTSGEGYAVETFPIEVRESGVYVGFKQRKWFGIF